MIVRLNKLSCLVVLKVTFKCHSLKYYVRSAIQTQIFEINKISKIRSFVAN